MGVFDYLLEPDNPPISAVDPLADVPDATGVNGDVAATEGWKPKYQPASTLLGMDLPDNVLPSQGDYTLQKPQTSAQQPIQQQTSNVDEYNALVKQYAQNGINPLAAYLDELKPDTKPDELRAERLKKIAAINSIGKALATVGEGVYGSQGAPIFRNEDKVTFPALQNALEAQDKVKQEKNRFALMRLQNDIQNLAEAKRMAADEMGKKWTIQQQEAARKAGREEWDRQYGIERRDKLSDYEKSKGDSLEERLQILAEQDKYNERNDTRQHQNRMAEIGYQGDIYQKRLSAQHENKLKEIKARGGHVSGGSSGTNKGIPVTNKAGQSVGLVPDEMVTYILQELKRNPQTAALAYQAQKDKTALRVVINDNWDKFYDAYNLEDGSTAFMPKTGQGVEQPTTQVDAWGNQIGGTQQPETKTANNEKRPSYY